MEKMILRTRPLGMALMILFDVLFFTVPLLTYRQMLQVLAQGDIFYLLGDVAAVYLVIYLTVSIIKNRIVLTDDMLSVQILESGLFYQIDSFQVNPREIEKIWIGDEDFLRLRLAGRKKILDRLQRYFGGKNGQTAKPRLTKNFVLVLLAADGRFFTVSIKPFSRPELKSLTGELKSRGAAVEIQKGIFKAGTNEE